MIHYERLMSRYERLMSHYERLMSHYERLMSRCERLKSGQEDSPGRKKVLRDAGTQRPEKGVKFQKKKVRKNIKSGLNGSKNAQLDAISSAN